MIGANVQLKDGLHTRSSTSRPVSPISVIFLISIQASLGRLSLNYSHLKSYKTVENVLYVCKSDHVKRLGLATGS